MTHDLHDLDALYRKHAGTVYRRAVRILGSDAEAREVVQDVFLSLVERPSQYEGKSTLTSFLYSMTTNACLMRLRSHRTRTRLLNRHGESIAPRALSSPDVLPALDSVLQRAPEGLAEVAVYYYMDKLTHEEIARVLDCSRRHVGNLLERFAAWIETQEQEVAPCTS